MVQIIPLSQPSLVASHIINLSHSPACEDSPHSPSQPSLPSQLMSAVLIPYPIPFNRKSQVVDGRPCITPKWDEPDLSYYPGFHMGLEPSHKLLDLTIVFRAWCSCRRCSRPRAGAFSQAYRHGICFRERILINSCYDEQLRELVSESSTYNCESLILTSGGDVFGHTPQLLLVF